MLQFPLISRCGKIATIFEESESSSESTLIVPLEEFPGGADTFFIVVNSAMVGG